MTDPKQELEAIFDKHRNKYHSSLAWQDAIKQDLLLWKEGKWKERKKLSDIIHYSADSNQAAKICIESVCEEIDEYQKPYPKMNLAELKQRLREMV